MSVFGARCAGFGWFIWPDVGWAMRECSDDVLFGMTRLSSSRLAACDALERGLEVKEGAMVREKRENALYGLAQGKGSQARRAASSRGLAAQALSR